MDYKVNVISRLKTEAFPTQSVAYTYDPASNRTRRDSGIAGLPSQLFEGLYDHNDRLVAPSYSWDNQGNMLTDERGRSYTYDKKNRLKKVTGTGVDVEYQYNTAGLRTKRTDGLAVIATSFLWNTSSVTGVPQVVEESENGTLARTYVYGPTGIISQTDISGEEETTHYFIRDAQGNVRVLLDETGNISDTFVWDAWGNLLARTGTTFTNISFHGEHRDWITGLTYLRARWYGPDIGRFINADTFKGFDNNPISLNKYLGFNGNAVMGRDPSGYFDMFGVMMSIIISGMQDSTAINIYDFKLVKIEPREGDGYYCYGSPESSYVTPGLLRIIKRLGVIWKSLYSDRPFGIGNGSKENGYTQSPSTSHYAGRSLDFRPFRKDNARVGVVWGGEYFDGSSSYYYFNDEYDHETTKKFVSLVESHARVILFNDVLLRAEGLTIFYPNHDNHLHIKFNALLF